MWKVVPLCEKQLRDIREEDILNDGLYRKCNTYRGGGGYDKFPEISKKYFGKEYFNQFVIQLYGCTLSCPYCYVTEEGYWGKYTEISTDKLIKAYKESGQEVFHLMGGAPAIYLEYWERLIDKIPYGIFHSDLMLVEKIYTERMLESIDRQHCLYAVNIKGLTKEEFRNNTNKELNTNLFYNNLVKIIQHDIPFYLTFTNCDKAGYEQFWNFLSLLFSTVTINKLQEKSFNIDLIDYEALK